LKLELTLLKRVADAGTSAKASHQSLRSCFQSVAKISEASLSTKDRQSQLLATVLISKVLGLTGKHEGS
jgi:hypothetical protein